MAKILKLVCILFSILLTNCVVMVISPVYPVEAARRGISQMEVGLVFATSPLVSFISSLQIHKIVSLLGSRNVAALGLIANALSVLGLSFSYYLSDNLFFIISLLSRSVGGFGLAAIYISSLRIIQQDFESKRDSYTSLLEAFGGLGLMMAPIYVVLTYETIGYSSLFFFMFLAILCFVPVYWCCTKLSLDSRTASEDSEEDVKMRLSRNLTIDMSMLVYGYLVLTFLEPALSLYLTEKGVDESVIGLVFTGMTLLYTLTNFTLAWVAKYVRLEKMRSVGVLICSAVLAVGGPVAAVFDLVWLSVGTLVVTGAGVAFGFSCIMPGMLREIRENSYEKGNFELNSVYSIGMNIGEVLGPAISGILVQYLGFTLSCAVISVIGAVLLCSHLCFRTRSVKLQPLIESIQEDPIS